MCPVHDFLHNLQSLSNGHGLQVQVAALSVELQSTASEVERASASAECIASAAAEVDKERKQSVQGLHDRLKSSEDTIERLSV